MNPIVNVRFEGYRSHLRCRFVWRGLDDCTAYVVSQDEFAGLVRMYGVTL